jgi:hypothetical protein
MYLTEGEAVIMEIVRVTSRGRIAHVSELALSWTQRLSSFVGIADSGTKLPWTSLDKRVGAECVSESDAKTSWTVDALYTLQSLIPTWHTLRDVTVADIVGCLVF